MRGLRWLPLAVVLLAAVTYADDAIEPKVDERLEQRVTWIMPDADIGDLAAKFRELGIEAKATRDAADIKFNLFCRDLPLNDVLKHLKTVTVARHYRVGKEPDWTYKFYKPSWVKTSIEQLKEQELRDLFRPVFGKHAKALYYIEHPDEIDSLIETEPGLWLLLRMPLGVAGLRTLASLPQDLLWRAAIGDETVRIRLGDLPDRTRDAIWHQHELLNERQAARGEPPYVLTGDTEIWLYGGVRRWEGYGQERAVDASVSMAVNYWVEEDDSWHGIGFAGLGEWPSLDRVRRTLEVADPDHLRDVLGWRISDEDVDRILSGLSRETQTDTSPQHKATQTPEKPDDPRLLEQVALDVDSAPEYPSLSYVLGELLKRSQLGAIVADCFTEDVRYLRMTPRPLYRWMDDIARVYELEWTHEDEVITAWHKRWFDLVEKDIPHSFVERWRKVWGDQGRYTLDDLAAMASELTFDQAKNTNSVWFLMASGADLALQSWWELQGYNALTGRQRAAALGRGLDLGWVSPAAYEYLEPHAESTEYTTLKIEIEGGCAEFRYLDDMGKCVHEDSVFLGYPRQSEETDDGS